MNTKELITYFEKEYNKKTNDFNDNEWYKISYFEYLTEEFIEKYQNKVKWYSISYCQKLSGEFINKYKEKINFDFLSKQNKINYLKYQIKHNIMSNEEYFKELLKLHTE